MSGSDDGTIKLWSLTTWNCEVTLHASEEMAGVLCLAVIDNLLISGTGAAEDTPASIKVGRCSPILLAQFLGFMTLSWLTRAALTPRCRRTGESQLITHDRDPSLCLQIWNTANWTCDRIIETHQDSIWAMQVCSSPDGMKLFSGSVDTTIQVWDVASWTLEHELTSHSAPVYALTAFEGKVMSGSDDEKIHVWRYDAEESVWKSERMLRDAGVWSLAHVNGRLVAGLASHSVKVFQ